VSKAPILHPRLVIFSAGGPTEAYQLLLAFSLVSEEIAVPTVASQFGENA
jgi:hypothetical protein